MQFYHPDLVASGPLVCTYSGCDREFDRFNSFSKHVKRHPPSESNCTSTPAVVRGNSELNVEMEPIQQTIDDAAFSEECVSVSSANVSLKYDEALTNAVVTHIAHLYRAGLTETQVQSVIDSHINLLNGVFLSTLKGNVMDLLSRSKMSNDVSESELNNVCRMFDSLMNMYDGFHTSYLRSTEYENCGAFIAPQEFVTGTALIQSKSGGKTILEPVELKGQFIPLRHVLKGFLELPGVYRCIMDYVRYLESGETKGIRNVIQGNLWKTKLKPMFVGKIVLPIAFLFDDYETGKELGFHTGVHSLGAGYIRLLCLPPQFSSQLENIFLMLLFFSSDKDFGNRCVFHKVVDELRFLEKEGISVVTTEDVVQVYFAVCFVGGDNKGANEILGYVRGFSANRYCRMCSLHKQVMCKATKLDVTKARTPECYDRELRVNNQTDTGRYGECVFNALDSYHVYENFHVDVMHDWDEGIWKYVMTDIIRYFHQNDICPLDYLNELIQSFHYGPNEERNKPPLIIADHLKPDHNLRCSASEMRCLVRYFGLIVGHVINHNHRRVWNLYLLTRKIADIITAPVVYDSDVEILSDLMDKHHSLYKRLFHKPLKPKFHIALHGSEVMMSIGPLEPVSCIRIEAKHKEGSDVAGKSHNRVNLPYTVARHHQTMLAHRFIAGKGLEPNFECGKVTVTSVFSLKNHVAFLDCIPASEIHEKWNTVKWVKTNGMRYEYDCVVLISVNEDVPTFGRIHVIKMKAPKSVHFVLQCFQSIQFDEHVHAFEVELTNQWMFVDLNELQTYVATDVRSVNYKTFVPFRFSIKNC